MIMSRPEAGGPKEHERAEGPRSGYERSRMSENFIFGDFSAM